jgi:acyl-[acyl carrier protein]--UDP-N-acetylglucosamine O-acyltransferase
VSHINQQCIFSNNVRMSGHLNFALQNDVAIAVLCDVGANVIDDGATVGAVHGLTRLRDGVYGCAAVMTAQAHIVTLTAGGVEFHR